MWPIILITTAVLVIGLLIAMIIVRAKMKKTPPTDYYNLFVMGIIWLAFGAFAFLRYQDRSMGFFAIVGLIFAIIGILHRKDWKKNRRTWKQLTPLEQKLKLWTIIILTILVIAGIVALLIFNNS